MDVQKLPNSPPFTFLGTMRLTGDQKNFNENFEKKIQFGIFFHIFPHAGTVEENT